MNIVLLESLAISNELLASYAARLEAAGHKFAAYEKNTDPAVMIERAQDADVIMIANMPLPGEVIRACKTSLLQVWIMLTLKRQRNAASRFPMPLGIPMKLWPKWRCV